MERQFTHQSSERIEATELKDGADAYFRLGNPDHLTVEGARQAVAEATEKLVIKEVISQPQPHEYSRSYSLSLRSLRAKMVGGALDKTPRDGRSWSEFEVTK